MRLTGHVGPFGRVQELGVDHIGGGRSGKCGAGVQEHVALKPTWAVPYRLTIVASLSGGSCQRVGRSDPLGHLIVTNPWLF